MENNESYLNNTRICRLCLKLCVVNIDIFTDDLAKMVEMISALKVSPDDNLPKISCLKCARDVKSAFLVRRQIIQSYKSFQNRLNILTKQSNKQDSTSFFYKSVHESKILNSTIAQASIQSLKNILHRKNSFDNTKNKSVDNREKLAYRESDDSNNEFSVRTPVILDKNKTNICDLQKQPTNSHFKKTLTTCEFEQIQNLKLDINCRYIEKFESINQNIMKSKPTNEEIQLDIFSWMEEKQQNDRSRPTSHMKQKNKEPVKLYCSHCQVKFHNKITFKNHMLRHKNKTCPTCNKVVRSDYFKKHMKLHQDSPVICEVCGQTSKNPSSLRMHFFNYHKNPNLYVCEDCGKSFRTKTKLLYHQRKDHTKERNFKCEVCGKSFFLKLYLTKHINMKHMKLRPHMCEYCGKGFSGRHALRTHVRQHTNEAPFECNFCEEKFKQRVSLRGHLKSRHMIEENISVFCNTCGKGFASDVALDVHSRLHREMKCQFCSDTFAEKDYLEQHIIKAHPNINIEPNMDSSIDRRIHFPIM